MNHSELIIFFTSFSLIYCFLKLLKIKDENRKKIKISILNASLFSFLYCYLKSSKISQDNFVNLDIEFPKF